MATNIPFTYRLLFTYIDPIFCTIGLVTHLLDPNTTLLGYSAKYNTLLGPSTETTHLLDSMAGFFAMLGVLEAVLLRLRAHDGAVWRTVQGSVVLLDAFMVYAALKALSADGRLDVAGWRGDDWRLVVGNAGIGLVRLACAFGVGFRRRGVGKEE